MKLKVINKKLKRMIDFAELWNFIDVPIKRYSSGMKVRLGFSLAAFVDDAVVSG